ncbi:MAG TPA: c-type cytochrome [Gemmatimonadaceae bacterium]|jgi:cytochrome c oxidase cbb3-type subunit 3|nr:c-type cytochrome [Gemmatimonadaceae bacterium]
MRTTPTAPRPAVRRLAFGIGTIALLATLAACNREQRRFRESPPSTSPSAVRVSALQPGTVQDTAHAPGPYDDVAYHVSEGQRLFGWYNCAGCHANGGGGMGPPLMDEKWIYGSAPEQIFNTIVQGRPNGMPSFAGKIPTPQVWELVAYVRSLSAQNSTGARSARSDHMMMYPGSGSLQDATTPVKSFHPPAAEMP